MCEAMGYGLAITCIQIHRRKKKYDHYEMHMTTYKDAFETKL